MHKIIYTGLEAPRDKQTYLWKKKDENGNVALYEYKGTRWEKVTGQDSAETQVQSDWNESDNTKPSYIQNKPTIFEPLDVTSYVNKNFSSSIYEEIYGHPIIKNDNNLYILDNSNAAFQMYRSQGKIFTCYTRSAYFIGGNDEPYEFSGVTMLVLVYDNNNETYSLEEIEI